MFWPIYWILPNISVTLSVCGQLLPIIVFINSKIQVGMCSFLQGLGLGYLILSVGSFYIQLVTIVTQCTLLSTPEHVIYIYYLCMYCLAKIFFLNMYICHLMASQYLLNILDISLMCIMQHGIIPSSRISISVI